MDLQAWSDKWNWRSAIGWLWSWLWRKRDQSRTLEPGESGLTLQSNGARLLTRKFWLLNWSPQQKGRRPHARISRAPVVPVLVSPWYGHRRRYSISPVSYGV